MQFFVQAPTLPRTALRNNLSSTTILVIRPSLRPRVSLRLLDRGWTILNSLKDRKYLSHRKFHLDCGDAVRRYVWRGCRAPFRLYRLSVEAADIHLIHFQQPIESTRQAVSIIHSFIHIRLIEKVVRTQITIRIQHKTTIR